MAEYELSIVIPCKDELKGLPLLIGRYKAVKGDVKFQLVIVDNGSEDGTWDFLQEEIKKSGNDFIKPVRIEKNIGYGNGIQKGLEQCDAEVVGWSHGDMQCLPEDVFKGYTIYKDILDKKILVKGKRIGRDWKSLLLSYYFDIYTTAILWKAYNDINGQPKIFHKDLFKTFENPPKGFTYDLYVQDKALRKGYKVHSFKVTFEKRAFGISRWAYSTFAKISIIKIYMKDVLKIKFGVIR